MVIKIKANTSTSNLNRLYLILKQFKQEYYSTHYNNQTVIIINSDDFKVNHINTLEFIDEIVETKELYKLVNKEVFSDDVIVDVNGVKIGNKMPIVVIAGPCSVEDKESLSKIAKSVKASGAKLLRGGAYKPRTSPHSFLGLEYPGIELLNEIRSTEDIGTVSEIMDYDLLDIYEENISALQIGARNMQNYTLLEKVGKSSLPVVLKRGFSNTIEEWLLAAEYIVNAGNPNVILCERGIRTFETYTRNTLDLSVIQIVKQRSNLPIIIDPSHATGDYRLVESMSLAAIVAGADGLMIEVSDDPVNTISDAHQSLSLERFDALMIKARSIAQAIHRDI